MEPPYYNKTVEETFEEAQTSPSGLTSVEARRRLSIYGPNTLEKGTVINPFYVFLHQFMDPLIYILIIAAGVTTFLGDWIDTGVIIAVIIIDAIIGFSQEIKAEQAVSALKTLTAPRARVIRNGHVEEVSGEELVPGDIVLLASGTRVPADLRLIESIHMEVDESTITGESLPVKKDTAALSVKGVAIGDIHNMAFMGTLVTSGRGQGIVVATGTKTQLGSISVEVARVKKTATPLQDRLGHLSSRIGIAILGLSIVAVALGIIIGERLIDMLLTGIALAVGAIPEGLPVVVTITLAIGVKRMADKNAIIRRLPAVETLGSTTVIASDKTGTMTRNEMTVVRAYAGGRHYRVSGVGYSPDGEILAEDKDDPRNNKALEMCLRAGLLANESDLEFDEDKKEYFPRGDPTEVGLIVSAMKGGLSEGQERVRYVELDELPFESERMYMASLHREPGGEGNIAFIKGAPDRILGMCDRAMSDEGEEVEVDKGQVYSIVDSMGAEGLRVLAMAYKKFPPHITGIEPEMLSDGAVFLGLQGMYDPPREEVYEAIRQAKMSGIRVIMVTGDHKATALTIARKLGISGDDAALTGQELDAMTDDELYEAVGRVSVFSRVSPLHKLRIVQQLIRRGEVVAVTGDGVNDTPALKAAHIGVAMGKSGTDAAKETAEMIITDDNFASIFAAVKEGRVVFANIRKVVLFLLSSGFGQVIFILATLAMRLPLPLLPSQIIWMNLVTNGLQDVAMAFEPPEKGIEYQKPRPRGEPIISRLMAERLVVIGVVLALGTLAIYTWELERGVSIDKARTAALTTLVLYQLFNVFNARSETRSAFRMSPLSNPFLFFSIVASIIAQVAAIYWEPLQFMFRTTSLELADWLVIIPVAMTVILVVEAEKALRRLIKKG
ncbi:cation-translocating P-type ATPase [Methanocella conradii]|uniref:cation-translocating P-type ATPase n=1 Tax=Methanocella conradii TaxID=1175444 RepID=UPI0024B3592E|nr:HAD-IC family P-type ATPase [Methanocella conradii]MDI6897141.1 HAD-IC family P-type ATPase [Methanocella conradii]